MKITINPNLKAKFNFSKRFSIFIKKNTFKIAFFFFFWKIETKDALGFNNVKPCKAQRNFEGKIWYLEKNFVNSIRVKQFN